MSRAASRWCALRAPRWPPIARKPTWFASSTAGSQRTGSGGRAAALTGACHGRFVPRRNRVDPWGDLHAVASRGLLTGNRGCVVDDHERVVRHHGSSLWIICHTSFRGWRWPLARPRRWTPLFFLDDAVALAAGHRPCATCRRGAYAAYRDAVTRAIAAPSPLLAWQLNRRLEAERHRPG